jgi:3-phosphoshikimate 1-carboxyvinyltransferase
VLGEPVSTPYVDMTLHIMERFGVRAEHHDHRLFEVPGDQRYASPGRYLVEGDASSASYFLAAAAIRGGPVRVRGVGAGAIQGDVDFARVLRDMGAVVTVEREWIEVRRGSLRGVDLDLNHIPDAAMTLATTALFAEGRTRIRNIANWKVKETDRLHAMATELRKLGARVTTGDDFIEIEPPARLRAAEIETYDDHRIAMSFSLAALGDVPVTILNPGCTAKTFPEYFELFDQLTL